MHEIHSDEATALIAIKTSLVDPLAKLGGWNLASGSSHCTWDGVRCNARGVVTGLNLAGMNLSSTIPDDILGLTSIVLQSNAFEHERPQALVSIPSLLKELDVANLQLLDLMCNRLKGGIPASIGELPKLEVLELWNNSLTGPLPPSLGSAQPLQWLDVSTNTISGPVAAGLCDSGNLTKLVLFNNVFAGPIPAGLHVLVAYPRS
ncbi:MDIS1-interacting receptor like kinase 1-like [Setaria italica]|uniref:MDIS1-interacting receptor like kinase 1-like n=1 Tax=Setaria italica TaxID=4555 RepID=UPI0007199E35|nr:MDIS1-interacting receptor like kinase 1-like [Setaria italica]